MEVIPFNPNPTPTEDQEDASSDTSSPSQTHPVSPPDFMTIRRAISRCGNPVEVEAAIIALHAETGLKISVIRECAKEVIAERKRREKEHDRERRAKEAREGNVIRFAPQPAGLEWKSHLLQNKDGEIKDCPANILLILQEHADWQGKIELNRVTGRVEINRNPITDVSLADIAQWLALTMKMSVRSIPHILFAARKVADSHAYNPITEWLESLPSWDNTCRLDTLFADILGSPQSPYTAYIGRILFVSLIARAYQPGCIVRSVIILEGKEKIGKSLFVRDVGHPWSGEILTSLENAVAAAEVIQGIWLAELTELDSLGRARESRVKAFVTIREDRYRAPYGHVSEDRPRLTVFIGTVNPAEGRNQFREEEENTRWLPIRVEIYERDAFLFMRDQVFAEALAFYRAHPSDWWDCMDSVHAEAQALRENRTVQDPWREVVANYAIPHEEVTIPRILDALEVPLERRTRAMAMRIGSILHGIGWKPASSDYTSGKRIRVYKKATI